MSRLPANAKSSRSPRPRTTPRRTLCAGLLVVAAHAPSALSGEPTAVVIPEALREHVPMAEFSGLVWAPTLGRYLVVVDDSIDLDENSRRAPFVLAVDSSGHVDADIVPLASVNALDDAEALAGKPDGTTFFLLTSHSPTRKGKVRKSRRQLLQLKLEGRRLRATGSLNLLDGGDDLGRQLSKLGLPEGVAVDLEGLTYHDGALYVGLKAPLLADGSAIILRLERPDQAFAAGKLPPNTLSVWGRAKLSVPPLGGGPVVGQGIADLVFASDGALYLCANAPKAGPKDGGGALWRVATPGGGGTLNAKLLRRFAGLKPEGVAAAPGGGALALVFDRNSRDPLWMSWPLGPKADAGSARRSQP